MSRPCTEYPALLMAGSSRLTSSVIKRATSPPMSPAFPTCSAASSITSVTWPPTDLAASARSFNAFAMAGPPSPDLPGSRSRQAQAWCGFDAGRSPPRCAVRVGNVQVLVEPLHDRHRRADPVRRLAPAVALVREEHVEIG